MTSPLNVAILIFHDVEVLDFCGPFEVFSVTGRHSDPPPFHVYTCAQHDRPILTVGRLSVNPHHTLFDDPELPPPDILIIPGGIGTRRLLNEPALIDWITTTAATAQVVLSVCTGALLLAQAGLLNGLTATTHHAALDLLAKLAPDTTIDPTRRFIDNGKFITSAGISAGIDASHHLVARLLGPATATETAHYMEYDWVPDPPPEVRLPA